MTPLLGAVGGLGGDLCADHHAVGRDRGTRRERLALALDLDEALSARSDRIEQRVTQNRGIWMPIPSRRGSTSVPLGTVTSAPSIVSVTRSEGTGWPDASDPMLRSRSPPFRPVDRGRRARRRPGRTGTHGPDVATYSSRKYFSDDMIGLAAPSPSATERLARIVSETSSNFSRSSTLPSPRSSARGSARASSALTARGALAAGLVRVELRPAQHHPHDARRLVEDLQRLGAEHGSCTRHPLVVERYVEVFRR